MAETRYTFKPDKYSAHLRILRLVGDVGPAPLRILDVGTAQGYMGKALSEAGHYVCGIEYDAEWAVTAQPHYREPIQVGDLDVLEPKYPDGYFDIILISSVLEHLKNPDQVLRKLSRCLKAGGKFVLAIPNVANWYIRLQLLLGRWNYEDRGIMDRTHLRFFTRKTFIELVQECGLRVTASEATPIPLPLVSPLMAPGGPLYVFHVINNAVTQVRPPLFAFSFILVAERSAG